MILKINDRNNVISDEQELVLKASFMFLERYLENDDKVSITINKQGQKISIGIFFIYNNKPIKITQVDKDCDLTISRLEKLVKTQIEKRFDAKNKQDKDREAMFKSLEAIQYDLECQAEEHINEEDDDCNDIVKEKIIVPTPMTEKEAKEKMQENGYDTYIFINSNKDNAYCSLYTRNDGTLGLLVMSKNE